MRVGVLSDIHGNLEALQACLSLLEQEGAETYIQCGDIIGYGPDAEACVNYVSKLPLLGSVMGNHDAILAFPSLGSLFNFDAKLALDENIAHLSASSANFLRTLPTSATGDNFTVLHGTPLDPIKEYFHSIEQFNMYFQMWQGQILFVGHTHLQFYIKGSARTCHIYLNQKSKHTISLQDKCRYVVNPGSVGRPRDHNPHAACGLWDTKAKTFTFLRAQYDVNTTQEKMRANKLPSSLVEGLAMGL
jgi:putative phosphoesterase